VEGLPLSDIWPFERSIDGETGGYVRFTECSGLNRGAAGADAFG
jgi:hypothetical protein